jgi:hypothetical protein
MPIVAFIDPNADFIADEFEVAELLEVPLEFILDRANYRQQSIFYKGQERPFWELTFESHRVWGATAGMLRDFALIVTGQSAL